MTKISHILLRNPVVVPTGTKLSEAAQLMREKTAGSVLISRNGRLAGIISLHDIITVVADGTKESTVDEVMQSPALTIDAENCITDAIEMFKRTRVTHLTVVEKGEKVGIIRSDDILHTYRFNTHVHSWEKDP